MVPRVPDNPHLLNITMYFGRLAATQLNLAPGIRFVFLCYTNRSGSNYFAEMLASDGHLPLAGENLNYDTVISHAQLEKHPSFAAYFEYLVRLTQRNATVCIKVAPSHLEVLARSGILEQIIGVSQFIMIERSDKLAQAISHVIAFQTGKFTSTMPGQRADSELIFDANLINIVLTEIIDSYRNFNLFFGYNGLVPVMVNYERMAHDPAGTIAYVAAKLGVPNLRVIPEQLTLGRQAGPLNASWRAMYLAAAR